MAKKVELKTTQDVEVVEPDTVETQDQVVEKEVETVKQSKAEKKEKANNSKQNKNAKTTKKNKNGQEKRSLGKKIKESLSELKKVSWPTFGTTVKKTGVVITVVAACTLILFGIDRLFGWLYTLLT